MRTLLIATGLSAFLACGNLALAESPGQQLYEKDEPRASIHPLTPADRVHERAAIEARARLQRIENRHAAGISLGRPTIYPEPLKQEIQYVSPWGLYGLYPPGYIVWVP
jgi:hypothetical protein